ncbi:CAAX prenyl protease 2 isoform X4 [Hippopotamus amphibius kiboko]|uniref:CAAX prenyl protease 2 isoform X4 n=1 Tax=Hippopotamus amphibius kiboko TaxID=575201 RepID=UPI002591C537|nr:CAAX prenyl protease 2 isoform X4 [Hippopotamus amphibius kiboko]
MAALGGDGLRLLSVSRPERQPESAALGGPGPGLCCWVSVFSCLSLACSYVGSLYVWKSELPRDHPAVIKRRFTSVLVVSSLSPLCVLLWRELTGIQPGTSLLTLMGFRLEGIFPAALLPLLLTMILFLGPLMQLSMDCPCDLADGLKVVLAPRSWARCLTDMRWLRNQVIAPLTEELVFRACMLPMLAPCTGLGPAVFTCPLFFGVAHFHHIFEQLRFRQSSVGSIFLSAGHAFCQASSSRPPPATPTLPCAHTPSPLHVPGSVTPSVLHGGISSTGAGTRPLWFLMYPAPRREWHVMDASKSTTQDQSARPGSQPSALPPKPRISEAESWELPLPTHTHPGGPSSAEPSSSRATLPGKRPGRDRSGTAGPPTRPGPLTHSFKQRATAGLLGNLAAQTNRAGGGGRLVPERARRGRSQGRRREGPAAGAGHGASPEAEPSRPHPAGALPGDLAPNPALPPQGPCLVGTLHVTW